MRLATALVLAVLGVAARALTPNATRCLRRFSSDEGSFARCRSQPCFLFLEQEPYVIFDRHTAGDAASTLFPCGVPPAGISGSAFAVHNATSPDALCTWAGADCLFGDLTAFIDQLARSNSTYQFAATGLLVESPARITETLYPSSSLLDTQLIIIGPADDPDRPESAVSVLLRPFRRGAWVLFWAMLGLFVLLGLVIVAVFAPAPFRWSTLFFHFIGEPVDDDDDQAAKLDAALERMDSAGYSAGSGNEHPLAAALRQRRETSSRSGSDPPPDVPKQGMLDEVVAGKRASYRAALWLYRIALSSFVIIFILFYEISVVNFLFLQNRKSVSKSIAKLTPRELSEYAVLRSSALEEVWRKTVDPFQYYESENFPWYRCSTPGDCFDQVLKRDNNVNFVVTFDNYGNYELLKRKACNQLTAYSTERKLYSFGAGWLYGKGVRPAVRREIDKGILDLRVNDQMRKLMNNFNGKTMERMACAPEQSDISAGIVGLAILVLVGPSLSILTVILVVASYKGTWMAGPVGNSSWSRSPMYGESTRVSPFSGSA